MIKEIEILGFYTGDHTLYGNKPEFTFVDTQNQVNIFYKLHKLTLEDVDILGINNCFSVGDTVSIRTRQLGLDKPFLVIKNKVNGNVKVEVNLEITKEIEAYIYNKMSLSIDSAWKRKRWTYNLNYKDLSFTVHFNWNTGYGHTVEVEFLDEEDTYEESYILSLIEEIFDKYDFVEINPDLLDRMYTHYCRNYDKYWRTDTAFIGELQTTFNDSPQRFFYGEDGYLALLDTVLRYGSSKEIMNPLTKEPYPDKYIKSMFGVTLSFDLSENTLPVYTSKKVAYRLAIEEMIWFLQGSGDVAELIRKNVNIWNEWAYDYYKKENSVVGTLCKNFTLDEFVQYVKDSDVSLKIPLHYTNINNGTRQCDWVVDGIKSKPYRKSYYVDYWKPEDTYEQATRLGRESVVIAACHHGHQVVIDDDQLKLLVNIRSNDLFLGNPFNVTQYAFLAHLYAHQTGYKAKELVVSIGDAHIYSDHIEQIKNQLEAKTYKFPTISFNTTKESMSDYEYKDVVVENYISSETIKAPLTFVGGAGS